MSGITAIVIGGVGSSGGASTPPTPPGNPILLSASAVDTTPDASGTAQKLVTVTYQPPSPLGTYTGGWEYLDAPDTAGQLAIADGTQGADGNTPAAGTFNPSQIGFASYDPKNPVFQIQFTWPAPTVAQLWRFYLAPGSANTVTLPVQYGQTGASPSIQFLVQPPATSGGGVSASGREYAPNVLAPAMCTAAVAPIASWATNPLIIIVNSGDQFFQFAAQWNWPVGDQNFASLGGVNFILYDGIGHETYLGDVVVSAAGLIISGKIAMPIMATNYTLYIISFDVGGNSNTVVPGVTPQVQFTITPQVGPPGEEYSDLVLQSGSTAFVTASGVSAADGTQQEQVTATWVSPVDQRWGGAEIDVLKPDGNYYTVGKGVLSPLQDFIPPPIGVVNWAFYLRSIDINGRSNTITPQIQFSGGGGSGAVFAPIVTGGVLASCTQLNGGSGYTSAPTATLVDSTGAAIPGVSLTAIVTSNAVASITVNTGGSNIIATPLNVISVGSNTGLLNLAQSNASTFSGQFAIVAGAFTVSAINANVITTGVLKVGNNGSGYPIELEVFDHLGSLIGWVGDDTGVSGYVGAWFKQCRIGGANPTAAPLVADSSGNVTMPASSLTAGTITAAVSMTAPTLLITIATGHVINLDATNYLSMSNAGTDLRAQMTEVSVTFTDTSNSDDAVLTYQGLAVNKTLSNQGSFLAYNSLTISNSSSTGVNLLFNFGVGGILQLADGSNVIKATVEVGSSGGGSFLFADGSGSSALAFDAGSTYTASSASLGGGSALPVTPVGYLIVTIGGSSRRIPYFNP